MSLQHLLACAHHVLVSHVVAKHSPAPLLPSSTVIALMAIFSIVVIIMTVVCYCNGYHCHSGYDYLSLLCIVTLLLLLV